MNYQKIHDALIERARHREYNKQIHHLHHIIPRCENKNSKDCVPLTFKEHYIVHFLRYKINGIIGNKLAYCFMRGNTVKYLREHIKKIQSDAGKIGGKVTKDNKLGIFSDDYDRSCQSRQNFLNGIGLGGLDEIDRSKYGAMGGKVTKDNKLGIFSDDYDRSPNAILAGQIGGRSSVDKKAGIHNEDYIKTNHKINCSKGGKIGGKKVGSLFWWTDGIINIKSMAQPSENFRRGMTKNLKTNKKEYKDDQKK